MTQWWHNDATSDCLPNALNYPMKFPTLWHFHSNSSAFKNKFLHLIHIFTCSVHNLTSWVFTLFKIGLSAFWLGKPIINLYSSTVCSPKTNHKLVFLPLSALQNLLPSLKHSAQNLPSLKQNLMQTYNSATCNFLDMPKSELEQHFLYLTWHDSALPSTTALFPVSYI